MMVLNGMAVKGKVAIVTGAGSGIGRATAIMLAHFGARVTVADLVMEKAVAVAEEICKAGGRAIGHTVDIRVEAEVKGMVDATVQAFGGLDILHNNAADTSAATFHLDDSMSVQNMEVELWDSCMSTNLRGAMLGCKWAIPEMLKRGGGSIINTSSNSSLAGRETALAYGVSKAGVNALTQYVATSHGKQGIRSNAIAPGLTMTQDARKAPAEFIEVLANNTLTPYLGEPEDLAAVVVFLASDAARYVTGQIIAVDGGMTSHMPYYSDLRRLANGK